jgi:2,5-diketo-D-gluconate reductase A
MSRRPAVPTVALPHGAKMPMIGFGTFQLRGEVAYRSVRHALDVGYRHIDTAVMYGNHAEVGRAIRDSGIDRADVFLTSKWNTRRAGIGKETQALERALDSLGLDYLDLWLIHFPLSDEPLLKTWEQFLQLRDRGMIRAAGVSNYSTPKLDELTDHTGQAPEVNQIKISPKGFDPSRIADLRDRDVAVEGYSPLKGANLNDPVLTEIAEGHRVTAAQVVLRWHLEHDIIVIPRSAVPERIEANFALATFLLSVAEIGRIDKLSTTRAAKRD